MNLAADIWAEVLALLQNEMTTTTINAWFDDAVGVALEGDKFILYSPTPFKRDIIASRYVSNIQNALQELFSSQFQVEVLTEGELSAYEAEQKQPKKNDFFPGTEEYTFERFVVGSSNKFAHAAALAVAEMPGQVYNPLYIHGESGLGKTHLLYAIAHTVHQKHPNMSVVYVKGETFTNELIQAIREGRNQEFRDKYRFADVFLMDDVQFVAGRASTQEELFHTFNSLYELKKQIVFTSDRPPKEMLRLEDRLKTRFEWGLLADIQPPDYETRMAIIKNKAISLGLELPDDVCNYIANNVTSNVRQIEGTVKKILAYRDLNDMPMDLPHISRAIDDMFKNEGNALPTPSLIINQVCKFYSIDESALRGTQRNKGTVEARQVAMYLIRKLTNLSTTDIGEEFNKDHTTMLYSIEKVEAALAAGDENLKNHIRDITANINSSL